MNIKFAEEIVKEMEERGKIKVPKGYVTGEAFEEWLYGGIDEQYCEIKEFKYEQTVFFENNTNSYKDNYGEAA